MANKLSDALCAVLLVLLPLICIVGMFSVPIAILHALENAETADIKWDRDVSLITEIVPINRTVFEGHCDVTRTDGGVERFYGPMKTLPFGVSVDCTGDWATHVTEKRVTKAVWQ